MPSPIIGSSGSGSNTGSGRHTGGDARMQNTERQKRLVNDTERLVSLTNQLKAAIASSGAEALTPEMLRQMDEIEKLARSVKNRMRN
jgi:hypothetical protein